MAPDAYTAYYKSVIVFGTAHILEKEAEKRLELEILAAKYTPDDKEGRLREIEKWIGRVCMIELGIDHITGKQSIELLK